ncbi:MAG: outer membrane protein assembly factor BamD [Bacteroidales bacterium]|nr:outer membrane protein assembly factor BamD [Candidatus Cacconaster merdequi]
MKVKSLFAAVVVLIALASCKSQYDIVLSGQDADEKYKMAFDLFNAKKFSKAAEMFESLSLLTRGTAQDDTVQYYWALSNYNFGDYPTAESNFDQFISTYPVSVFIDEAMYLRLDCLYRGTYRYELDQQPTYKAINEMNIFMREHPQSQYFELVMGMVDDLKGRLELKSYKSAYLYYHMEDYQAAHYALKNVLKDNADNRYREEILYYTALSAYKYAFNSIDSKKKERYLTFVDDYLNVIGEYPETKYRKELDALYDKVQKVLRIDNSEEDGK